MCEGEKNCVRKRGNEEESKTSEKKLWRVLFFSFGILGCSDAHKLLAQTKIEIEIESETGCKMDSSKQNLSEGNLLNFFDKYN